MNPPGTTPQATSALEVAKSHTPGPWTVGQHPALNKGWIVRPVLFGSRTTRLPLHEGGHTILKNEADAHLIAAAPDLLEALKVAAAALEEIAAHPGPNADEAAHWRADAACDALHAIGPAISKAEGIQ